MSLSSNRSPKKLKATDVDWKASYNLVLQSINAFAAQGLSHSENMHGCIIDNAIKISLFLLLASRHVNPRSLSIEGQQQLALGDTYHEHSLKKGAFLKDIEIPSHVSAAQTDERVAHVKIKKGTRLLQYVRPRGYLGDYYAASDKTQPDQLGTSMLVTDPNDATQVVNRVKLEIIAMADAGFQARVSTAKPVVDFWSIKGQTVHCAGGGEQHYMPLPVPVRQSGLVLLGSDDKYLHAEIEAIAKANGIRVATKKDVLKELNMIAFADAYTREEVIKDSDVLNHDCYSMQRMAYDALLYGNYQMASTYLNFAISKRGVIKQDKIILGAILGLVYLSLGQSGRGIKLARDYLHYYENMKQVNHHDTGTLDELTFHVKLHLARAEADPRVGINLFNELLAVYPHKQDILSSVIMLEIGIRYNIIANEYSDEVTFEDFDDFGKQDNKKKQFVVESDKFLNSALKNRCLPVQESLICMIELAFSYHKQRRNIDALNLLLQVEQQLVSLIQDVSNDFSRAAILDLKMQLLGVRLGIGLNLARCKDVNTLPDPLKLINPVTNLLRLSDELEKSPPMMVKLIFNRWVGRNANNLFIEGWFQKQGAADDLSVQGARLIGLYRKFIPLDVDRICRDLEANKTEKLDLAYLGMPEPAGISDTDFLKIAKAIACNTSLKALFIRKFSRIEHAAVQNNSPVPFVYRAKVLFDALSHAQSNGQHLEYLSYSGARFNNTDEMMAVIQYLQNNKKLKILQASLYYWTDASLFRQLADTIQHHPSLTTLLTAIFKLSGAGEMVYQAGIHSPCLRYVYPFPGRIANDSSDHGVINNEWMKKLANELSARHIHRNAY
jgi:hypothetical protein